MSKTIQLKVKGISRHIIKSCKETILSTAHIDIYGIERDRQLMIVEQKSGMFVSQRSDKGQGIAIKSMCLIEPIIASERGENSILKISAPDMPTIKLSTNWENFPIKNLRQVQIWNEYHEAISADKAINQWFTEYLSRERPGNYEIVIMKPDGVRRARKGYSQLRFADAYPFLVTSQESLDDLNNQLKEPVPMNRFRSNIVLTGGYPYVEDDIERMVINGVEFEWKKLCVRCPIISTDQNTAARSSEPLKTLLKYRPNPDQEKGGAVFGSNFNHLSTGIISVGDTVEAILK